MSFQITKPTPLYAAVGAGDALVAKVRGGEVPKVRFDVDTLINDLKSVQGQAKAIRITELPGQFKQVSLTDLQAQVRSLQVQLKTVQGQAQHAATDTVGQLGKAYADFAKRGEEVVNSVRSRDLVHDVRGNVDDFAYKARSGASEVIDDVKDRVSKLQGDVESASAAVAPEKRSETKPSEPEAKPTANPAEKPASAKSAAKEAPAKASTAKKAPAKTSTAKKAPAKNSAKKAPAKKSTTKKS